MGDRADAYRILGLRPGASAAEIAGARRRLARLHHPDLSASPADADAMRRINWACEVLAHASLDPVVEVRWQPAPVRPGPAHAATSRGDSGAAAWWVLGAFTLLLVAMLVAGVAGAAMGPAPPSEIPTLHDNYR